MARDYGRIRSQFWPDEKVAGWSMAVKGFAAYLLTSEHTTALGCFRLPLAYICADLRIPAAEARGYMAELTAAEFCTYDEKSGWIWIRKYLEHNWPENPSVWKHVRRLAASMPANIPFRAAVIASIPPPDGSPKSTETPSKNGADTVSTGSLPIPTQPIPTEPNRTEPSQERAADAAVPEDEGAGLASDFWGRGSAYLEAAGIKPTRARTLLGKWRKDHGEPAVVLALFEAQRQAVSEPVAWLERRLSGTGPQGRAPPEERKFTKLGIPLVKDPLTGNWIQDIGLG